MIENVQRRATKLDSVLRNLSYSEGLKRLGLPTLEYRRERADLVQTYKILNDIDRLDIDKIFKSAQYTNKGSKLQIIQKESEITSKCEGQQFQ